MTEHADRQDTSGRSTAVGPVRAIAAVLALLLLGAVGLIAWGGRSAQSSPLIGRIAPPIHGEPLAGGRIDLDEMRGRWVVVNFFAPWCTECIVEQPELQRFARRHSNMGDARLVSVVEGSTGREATAFLEAYPAEWPFVLDRDGAVGVSYGFGAVPETYLIAPDGVVVAKFIGRVTADQLDAAIGSVAQSR